MDRLIEAAEKLESVGISLDRESLEKLRRHGALIREWNERISLVSAGDVGEVEGRHTVDALSLAPILVRRGLGEGLLVDVGSGAGFPGIPLAVALPGLRVVLVERSERKSGFLRKAVGALSLDRVEVCCGEFPRAVAGVKPDAITSRAVERPEKVMAGMVPSIERGAVLLCQAGDPRVVAPKMFHVEPSHRRFHVEHWQDDWTRDGLRRGELYLVSRADSPNP